MTRPLFNLAALITAITTSMAATPLSGLNASEASFAGGLADGTYTGVLYDGQRATLDLDLYGGYQYTYAGRCDIDCYDLDFILYRWRGGRWVEVDRDTLTDAFPLVVANPQTYGTYRLVITMVSCTVQPCSYTVEVD